MLRRALSKPVSADEEADQRAQKESSRGQISDAKL
jgi:hypothetical protein